MKLIVLDASAALAGAVEEVRSADVRRMTRELVEGDAFLVPVIWRFEVGNGFLMAVRRGRIGAGDAALALSTLDAYPIMTDDDGSTRAWSSTFDLARRHNLTLYDAAYLELALRAGAALATLDRHLAEAARAEGVWLAI